MRSMVSVLSVESLPWMVRLRRVAFGLRLIVRLVGLAPVMGLAKGNDNEVD